MKKIILTLALIAVALLNTHAQSFNSKGCWVIESNKGTKLQTVRFYDDNQELVYEEATKMKLDAKKEHVQKLLNTILAAFLAKKQSTAYKNVLAVAFQYN